MKVLFAVSNEKITEQVVAKYQVMFNELLSYKEVYYYNAIVKELEKNKDYNAIVIDESLESVSNDKGDQYLLNNLDAITDIAVNNENTQIPIILICKADRQPAEEFLEKIYKIGIFNALILKDRKISKICEYINNPRNKKDAKKYYQINVDDTEVVADTEHDSIAKTELKNILNYYAKLGNDTSKYSETFERIAEQYTDVELVYIIARFPENVKNVLMSENQRFRNLMSIDPSKLQQMEQAKKQQEMVEKPKPVVHQEENTNTFIQEEAKDLNVSIEPKQEENIHIVSNEYDIEEKEEQVHENKNVAITPNIEPQKVEVNNSNSINDINVNTNPTNTNVNYNQNQNTNNMNYNYVEQTPNMNRNIEVQVQNVANQVNSKNVFSFVGTSKNGTSFLVNSLAILFSSIGINTAIVDLTKNKNDYYMCTNNEDRLREIATLSIIKLEKGIAEGVQINKNLSVYTGLPTNDTNKLNSRAVIDTLKKNHTLILLDCDFETNLEYYTYSNQIFTVQSLDVLTMQPLTIHLKKLKELGIISDSKISIILNKEVSVKGLTKKLMIGGLSMYNSPNMEERVQLFNKDNVKVYSVPFDIQAYQKYLENIVHCKFEITGYPKKFITELQLIAENIYPEITKFN
ncbi:MAG: hypothetical protein HXK70_02450 [Clostridiales bacterium]|nr:hypothetical protein [Clostridiales bacterium]